MTAALHRGVEAWLENSKDVPTALSEGADVESNTISAWVNVTPRQVSPPACSLSCSHLRKVHFTIVFYTEMTS